jgi:PleD family two-component response regulator
VTNCSEGEDGKVKGSIFWFSVPATLPDERQEKKYGTPEKDSDAESIQKGSVQKDVGKLEIMNTKNNHKMVSEAALKEAGMMTIGMDHLLIGGGPVVKMSVSKSVPKNVISSMAATTPNSFAVEPRIIEDEVNDPIQEGVSVDVLHEGSSCNSENSVKRPRRRKKFALIIDDSRTIRKVLKRALTNFGFEVILAENGMLGLEEMKSTVFDIVLCDFLMPIMDGMDCVKQYREWESNHRSWFEQVSAPVMNLLFMCHTIEVYSHFLLCSTLSGYQLTLMIKMEFVV